MPNALERRQALRIVLVGRPGARTLDGLPVWLTDLSLIGARLTHTEPLHPGAILTLLFPPELDGLRLVARIGWTSIYGSEQTPEGECHTLY